MKTNRFPLLAAALAALVIVSLTGVIHGNAQVYEVRPEITIPAYKTDTARAIEAYEKLMARYMDLSELHAAETNADIRDIARTLESMDKSLLELSRRLSRIEKEMGIKPIADQALGESETTEKDSTAPPKSQNPAGTQPAAD